MRILAVCLFGLFTLPLLGCSGATPSCATGQLACGAACIDPTTDAKNCGACGAACTAGMSCVAGKCATVCPMGQKPCGSTCANFMTDNANCGGCGTACASGMSCSAGKCMIVCPSGQMPCGSTCANLMSDDMNCGMCGTVCPSGQRCSSGNCVTSCPSSQTACGMTCADLMSDANNCGACGVTCSGGQSCVGGACACPSGQTLCGGTCTNTMTDNMNCGACGSPCMGGTMCAAGSCSTTCPGSQMLCGTGSAAVCTNLQTDAANCGSCANACPAGQDCAGGACACPTGLTACNGSTACTNLMMDTANCGTCGHACPTGQSCSGGSCACPTGTTSCGTGSSAACVNTMTDPTNCGGCGMTCGAGQSCTGGGCACPSGTTACGTGSSATCTNVMTDAKNCGKCGNACAQGSICSSGACISLCPSGQKQCPSNNGTAFICVDTTSDPTNCGACGTLCPSGTPCHAGTCKDGPLSSYWFEDSAGTTTYSDSGSASNVLAVSSTAPVQVAGYSGKGLQFNNNSTLTEEFLTQGAPKNLPLANTSRTLEAWVQPGTLTGPTNDGTYNGIIAYGQEVCTGQGQLLSMTNAYRVSSANWCNDLIEPSNGPAGARGLWSHVAFTWNGTTRLLYLDGVQVANDNGGGGFNTINGELRIGTTDEPGRLFNGIIDEARIYGTARTAAEMLDDATLVARYWFDSADGTDIGPNHITAMLNGGVTATPGHTGKGVALDGKSNTSIAIPSLTGLGIANQAFSIEMWINPPAPGAADLFDVHSASGWCTPFLGLDAKGRPAAQVWTPGSKGVTASSPIVANTWTHLAMTWSTTNGLRLYVNGSLAASDATIVSYSASGVVDIGLIGNFTSFGCASNTVPNAFYRGSVDNVQIYSRERTAAEVQYDAAH